MLLSEAPVPALSLEPSAQQRQGDTVLAFGYPLGLGGEPSLTRGLISAFRQEPSGVQLVQTDAALNHGNSGGPIVNMRGNVIAIVEFGLKDSVGLNFGIASETVQAFLDGATFASPAQSTPTATPSPLPAPTPTATPVTGRIFVGDPTDIAFTVQDIATIFGGKWSLTSESRSAANQYSSGILVRRFQATRADDWVGFVNVWVEVYRDGVVASHISDAQAWDKAPQGLSRCDASRVTVGDVFSADCRIMNVILTVQVSNARGVTTAGDLLGRLANNIQRGPLQPA